MDLWVRFHSSNCGMCVTAARNTHTNNMSPSTADTLSPRVRFGSNWLTVLRLSCSFPVAPLSCLSMEDSSGWGNAVADFLE
eukprot:1236397-Amphidinium_carterae.1